MPPIHATEKKPKSSSITNDIRNQSHEKTDGIIEKKPKIRNFSTSDSPSPAKSRKNPQSQATFVSKPKEAAIKLAASKYPNLDDLLEKYRQNIEELKKVKESFFSGYLKSQAINQAIFDKLKGVHFGMNEKKIDNLMFINESKKLVTWNIHYNPFILVGLLTEDVVYDNLQVNSENSVFSIVC